MTASLQPPLGLADPAPAAQFNDEFCSCEAIVALEVIEHLEQHVLDKFAPMILGEYRPRLLLVTTPSS